MNTQEKINNLTNEVNFLHDLLYENYYRVLNSDIVVDAYF